MFIRVKLRYFRMHYSICLIITQLKYWVEICIKTHVVLEIPFDLNVCAAWIFVLPSVGFEARGYENLRAA